MGNLLVLGPQTIIITIVVYYNNVVISPVTLLYTISLQSCPTLCDPIDGSPPGSLVPGILQARTLEWVAISFSNAWKWKVKVKSLSRVRLLATPWTAAYQAPLAMGFSRQEYWSGVPLPSPTLLYHKTNQMKCITCYYKATRLYSYINENLCFLIFFPLPNLIELRKTKSLLLSCCFSWVIAMFNLAASFLPSRLSFTRLCHSVESDSLKN